MKALCTAAMLAAVGAMAFHELVDFSLQIPANAFIFTLLLALAMRMTGSGDNGALSDQHSAVSTRRSVVSQQWPAIRPAVLGAVALALAVISLRQEQIPYPYNLREPHTSAEARDLLQLHPANVFAHVSLLRLQESTAPLSWQLTISSAALWLEPTNPYIRDFHAAMLIRSGKTAEGMREISRSVLDSPVLSNHVYLSARLLPWLSTQEQEAAEDGFKKALAQKYPGALDSLAGFYGGLGRFWDQGRLYERAAVEESDKATISTFLVNAGIAYSKARDDLNAERMWRSAIGAEASDPRPYQLLATAVYGPKKNLGAAREIISDGIRNGASPLLLYLSLAEAAGKAGSAVESKAALSSAQAEVKKALGKSEDPYVLYLLIADAARRLRGKEEEKAALLAALDHRPRASNTLFRLANLYFEERDFDRAAFYYGKIATISPNAADVYFQLAVAEEGRYHFSAADKAYARAVELAPDNKLFKERYDSLRRRVAADRKS